MAEPSEEERANARSYMVSQAAKLSPPQLVAKLRADGELLYEALAAVPVERWRRRPAPNDWSAAELAGHAIEVTQRDAACVEAVLDGREPPAFILDEVGAEIACAPANAAEFCDAFNEIREAFFARILLATGDEHLGVAIDHPWFGPLNWREWLLFMRIHDVDHQRYVRDL